MKKYTSAYAQQSYDAIVIGSGMGGLCTAAILAKDGKKVLVLERHFMAGGFTHAFKRKKYEWDVGLHYVGDLSKNDLVKGIFDYITDEQLTWEPMDEVYDTAIIEGDRYEFVVGEDNLREKMISYFPQEREAINQYFKLVKKLNNSSPLYFCERLLPPAWSYLFSKLMRRGFLKYSKLTTYEVLRSLTSNEKLISVLCAQCGNYGLTPRRSSFAIHALIVGHYLEGGCVPVGGSANILKTILPGIEKSGGEVLVNAEVERILIENNTAVGVQMKNGDVLKAPIIISNAGARNTFKKLLQPSELPETITQELDKLKPSVSHLALYIGLDASDEELQLPTNNFWVYSSYRFDEVYDRYLQRPEGEPPLAYISFPSAKDPGWKQKRPGKATIQVLGLGSYERMKEWEQTDWMKRGSDYEAYKAQVTKALLDKTLEVLPQIKGHIEVCELSTPLSTKHFTNYQHGEIYGLEHTPERFDIKWLRPRTPIKNLYLTGQDIVAVGIASAVISGVLTAVSILRKNLYGKIKVKKKAA